MESSVRSEFYTQSFMIPQNAQVEEEDMYTHAS